MAVGNSGITVIWPSTHGSVIIEVPSVSKSFARVKFRPLTPSAVPLNVIHASVPLPLNEGG